MLENVTVAVSRRAQCGEGPYWDTVTQTVLWVDIVGKQVLRTRIGGETVAADYPQMVGAAAPRVGGGIVAAVESGFVLMDAEGVVTDTITVLQPPLRMNDAKVDPAGRYWAGSCAMDFTPGRGALWRLDENLNAELVLPGLTLPNGIGWSPDGTQMYFVDTMTKQLFVANFDPQRSQLIDEPRVIADGFRNHADGLCVDTDGNIWLAEYGNAAVHQLSPTGTKLRTVQMPTSQPTSCAFVGSDLKTLWVTSACADISADQDPTAGSIFEIHDHGATGQAVALFRG